MRRKLSSKIMKERKKQNKNRRFMKEIFNSKELHDFVKSILSDCILNEFKGTKDKSIIGHSFVYKLCFSKKNPFKFMSNAEWKNAQRTFYSLDEATRFNVCIDLFERHRESFIKLYADYCMQFIDFPKLKVGEKIDAIKMSTEILNREIFYFYSGQNLVRKVANKIEEMLNDKNTINILEKIML